MVGGLTRRILPYLNNLDLLCQHEQPSGQYGMKTVYTAVADPGDVHGGPAPLLSQGLDERSPPPLSPYLKVCIHHCSAPESSTETYPICSDFKINATQLRSVTEPAPKSLCEGKPYEALSDMVFVPVPTLSPGLFPQKMGEKPWGRGCASAKAIPYCVYT